MPKRKLGSIILVRLFPVLAISLMTWLVYRYVQLDKRIEILASFFSGIVGTIIGAYLAFRFAKLQLEIQSNQLREKTLSDVAFEMLRVYESREMLEARGLAHDVLLKYSGERFGVLVNKRRTSETGPIWVVIGFYKNLWLMIQNNRVDMKLTASLFGEHFYWWYVNFFKDRLIPFDGHVSDNIKALKDWFDNNLDEKKKELHIRRAQMDKDMAEGK